MNGKTNKIPKIYYTLNNIDGVIFVGGSARFVKGLKKETKDIDIVVNDINILKPYFNNIIKRNDKIQWDNTKGRYRIDTIFGIIDVWEEIKPLGYILHNGFKIRSIENNIKVIQYVLDKNTFNNPLEKEKLKRTLEILNKV